MNLRKMKFISYIYTLLLHGFYVPHQTGRGHIVFGADPFSVSIDTSVRVTVLFARYLMNQWVDFN